MAVYLCAKRIETRSSQKKQKQKQNKQKNKDIKQNENNNDIGHCCFYMK